MPHVEQVGGDHYQRGKLDQHWDIMERWDVAYLEGIATKHVDRWDLKDEPREDLEKAISYLQKMLLEREGGTKRLIHVHALHSWMTDCGYGHNKKVIMDLVLVQGQRAHLDEAIRRLKVLLDDLPA